MFLLIEHKPRAEGGQGKDKGGEPRKGRDARPETTSDLARVLEVLR